MSKAHRTNVTQPLLTSHSLPFCVSKLIFSDLKQLRTSTRVNLEQRETIEVCVCRGGLLSSDLGSHPSGYVHVHTSSELSTNFRPLICKTRGDSYLTRLLP